MAQRIRPRTVIMDGDGFQFKPEKTRVVNKYKTAALQAAVTNSEVKITYVKKEYFAVAEYVRPEHKNSLTSVISILSIAVAVIGSIITLFDIIK